jgi:hypothetical protein
VEWESSAFDSGLPISDIFQYASGRIYFSNGAIVDPEINRAVGFLPLGHTADAFYVDVQAKRLYYTRLSELWVFDTASMTLAGGMRLPSLSNDSIKEITRAADGRIALLTQGGRLFIVQTSAIAAVAPEPARSPVAMPVTPGVTVVDRTVTSLAYDRSRDLIYASTPNSEAIHGDRIVAIAPGDASMGNNWKTGLNPGRLALSHDSSRLYFGSGSQSNHFASGFSTTSELLRGLDLTTGFAGEPFPAPLLEAAGRTSFGVADYSPIATSGRALAVIDNQFQAVDSNGGVAFANLGPTTLRIYENESPLESAVNPKEIPCRFLTPGLTADRLYCSNGTAVARLTVKTDGVSLLDTFMLLPSAGVYGRPVMHPNGRAFTTTGLVIVPEEKRVLRRLSVQGLVAVSGDLVYWLDQTGWTQASPELILRTFDANTLESKGSRRIRTTAGNATDLIVTGKDRLAFRAGREIYLVNP